MSISRNFFKNCVERLGSPPAWTLKPAPQASSWSLRHQRDKRYDPPRTRAWNLRLRRPTPYPLGQRAIIITKQFPCFTVITRHALIGDAPVAAEGWEGDAVAARVLDGGEVCRQCKASVMKASECAGEVVVWDPPLPQAPLEQEARTADCGVSDRRSDVQASKLQGRTTTGLLGGILAPILDGLLRQSLVGGFVEGFQGRILEELTGEILAAGLLGSSGGF